MHADFLSRLQFVEIMHASKVFKIIHNLDWSIRCYNTCTTSFSYCNGLPAVQIEYWYIAAWLAHGISSTAQSS